MKTLNTVLLLISVALTAIVLALVADLVPALQQYHDELSQLVQVDASPVSSQPYGGCDEAWQAPRSDGAQWCRDHGYAVPLK